MAFLDKLTDLASTASNKASSAIETGKMSLRINNEEKKITDYTLNIGQLLVDKLDAGETFDDEIAALYASIRASRDVIAIARAEIEANRQPAADEVVQTQDAQEVTAVCSSCGGSLSPEDRFCPACGTKVEAPAPTQAVCSNCGSTLAPGTQFCSQCGVKVVE